MTENDMAAAIALDLAKDGIWKVEPDWNEIIFTNEDGEKFRLTVEKIEDEEA